MFSGSGLSEFFSPLLSPDRWSAFENYELMHAVGEYNVNCIVHGECDYKFCTNLTEVISQTGVLRSGLNVTDLR